MTKIVGGLFDFSDKIQIESMAHRANRNRVITSNIANAETPGFRALGYDFETQLQAAAGTDGDLRMNVSHPKHLRNNFTSADGSLEPDVFIRPNESVSQDGNTVDLDQEMSDLAQNEILFRTAVDIINRKIAQLRYAINGGR
jgi:flagellar basal-body rod protein FlgB